MAGNSVRYVDGGDECANWEYNVHSLSGGTSGGTGTMGKMVSHHPLLYWLMSSHCHAQTAVPEM